MATISSPGSRERRSRRRRFCLAATLLWMISAFGSPVSGLTEEAPYYSYRYTVWDVAVETAPTYLADTVFSGLEHGGLALPSSVAADDNYAYVLDAGHGRVLVLDRTLSVQEELYPTDAAGEPLTLKEPVYIGLDSRRQAILICDKAAGIYRFDRSLRQTGFLGAPNSTLLPEGFLFAPTQVVTDSAGLYYVISENCYLGALQYDAEGRFIGFFGGEQVTMTLENFINYLWKQILSDAQAASLKRLVPSEFVGFCIDERDFIYTVRKGNDVTSGQVKKLNAKGRNILLNKVFGDAGTDSSLTAVTVDDSGFITVMDSGSGRLFQYDGEGNLLYIFGGRGERKGLSQEPVSLCAWGEDLLVLDRQGGIVTRYRPTAFARNIRAASVYTGDGRNPEAMPLWEAVLRQDPNYDPAHKGLGKGYEETGDFPSALREYRLAYDRELYSGVFGELRSQRIRESFGLFMTVLAVLIAVPVAILAIRRRSARSEYGLRLTRFGYPLYCLAHPYRGFSDMKERHGDSLCVGGLLTALFFAVSVMNRQLTGFAFRTARADQFNLPFAFLSTVGVFAAFAVCNWAVTTVMDGKGRLREIFNYCAYALLPYILGTAVMVLLSNVLTVDEAAFMHIGQIAVLLWTGASLLIALKEVHMYSLSRTLWTTALTLAGLVAVLVIAAIGYNVVTQFAEFVASLVTEIRMW